MRVLKWIVDRSRGRAVGLETPIGWTPRYEDIEWNGLSFAREKFEALQAFNHQDWRAEVIGHEETVYRPSRSSAAGNRLRTRIADLRL